MAHHKYKRGSYKSKRGATKRVVSRMRHKNLVPPLKRIGKAVNVIKKIGKKRI